MSKLIEVVNVGKRHSHYDVYIGRPSKWGNPFIIGRDGPREDVIDKYQQYILATPHLLDDLQELCGKTLGCYCKPLACHGDILKKLAYIQLLRQAGCQCILPLIGEIPDVGPRCRLCCVEVV